MKKKFLLAAGAVAWSALLAVSASAQERGWGETRIAAPQNAFEMSVNTGYTQGFGTLSPGVSLPNVSSAGVGVGLGLGYRVSPELLLGINGQYNELTSEGGYTGTRGVSAGVNADFHFAPTNRIDPWLSVGAATAPGFFANTVW